MILRLECKFEIEPWYFNGEHENAKWISMAWTERVLFYHASQIMKQRIESYVCQNVNFNFAQKALSTTHLQCIHLEIENQNGINNHNGRKYYKMEKWRHLAVS